MEPLGTSDESRNERTEVRPSLITPAWTAVRGCEHLQSAPNLAVSALGRCRMRSISGRMAFKTYAAGGDATDVLAAKWYSKLLRTRLVARLTYSMVYKAFSLGVAQSEFLCSWKLALPITSLTVQEICRYFKLRATLSRPLSRLYIAVNSVRHTETELLVRIFPNEN